jgi:hypothetical protein
LSLIFATAVSRFPARSERAGVFASLVANDSLPSILFDDFKDYIRIN